MLSQEEALVIAKKSYPLGMIQKITEYKNLYLLQIFSNVPLEKELDPFFSVDKDSGEFKEFSIIAHGDPAEITAAFRNATNVSN